MNFITGGPLLPKRRTAQLYNDGQPLFGVKFIAIPPTKGGIIQMKIGLLLFCNRPFGPAVAIDFPVHKKELL